MKRISLIAILTILTVVAIATLVNGCGKDTPSFTVHTSTSSS